MMSFYSTDPIKGLKRENIIKKNTPNIASALAVNITIDILLFIWSLKYQRRNKTALSNMVTTSHMWRVKI